MATLQKREESLYLIYVWLLNVRHTLSSHFPQFIFKRLLGPFKVVLLQEGKNSLQEVTDIQIIHYRCEQPA